MSQQKLFETEADKIDKIWKELEIVDDFEMTKDEKWEDRLSGGFEHTAEWEGTIKYKDYVFKWKFNFYAEYGNGGEGAEILSGKPKGMSKEDWNILEYEMQRFLEENYAKNRASWWSDC